MAYTQTKFYFIPKERISNLLGYNSKFENNSIVCNWYDKVFVTLTDYPIPQQIVTTPQMQAYVGMLGTMLVITTSPYADNAQFTFVKNQVNEKLKQYEL